MSIYIKGLNLPEQGFKTLLVWYNGDVTDGQAQDIGKAIEVPPHGDLFDRDLLEVVSYHNREGTEDTFDSGVRWLLEYIDGLLAVIRADPAEEEPT